MSLEQRLRNTIRTIPDYPKPGIQFKDITPILAEPQLMNEILEDQLAVWQPQGINAIAAIEARGFIFGSMLAQALKCPFIPVRKSGKLPFDTVSESYELEYGSASLEIHSDALQPGMKVLVHDDLLATGGTAKAAASLIQRLGGQVTGFSFLVNLSFLPGLSLLEEYFSVKPYYQISY